MLLLHFFPTPLIELHSRDLAKEVEQRSSRINPKIAFRGSCGMASSLRGDLRQLRSFNFRRSDRG